MALELVEQPVSLAQLWTMAGALPLATCRAQWGSLVACARCHLSPVQTNPTEPLSYPRRVLQNWLTAAWQPGHTRPGTTWQAEGQQEQEGLARTARMQCWDAAICNW